MSGCSDHREYLSALADGEIDLVPAGTVAHVDGCAECAREVGTQGRLSRMLVEAARRDEAVEPAGRRPSRHGRVVAAAAAVLALTVLGGTFGWRTFTGDDQVAAAASLAGQPPQLRSSDSTTIRAWCEREAERPVPEVPSSTIEPVGARMDRRGTIEIVTVSYVTGQHGTVRVSWLDATLTAPGVSSVQARQVSGRTVLVVTSRVGTAVVSGDAPLASLWDMAARIQAAAPPRPAIDLTVA
jgi:hypothetical protein